MSLSEKAASFLAEYSALCVKHDLILQPDDAIQSFEPFLYIEKLSDIEEVEEQSRRIILESYL
jgi:hypothetical protein